MSLSDNGQNTDDVYARVREAILDGELAPGAVMSQVALAEELGISRTPLREALRMLQSERLVEAEAIRLSVARLSPENLARLEGYMAEMAHYASAKDYRRWTVPHRNFHRALTAPAGERINDLLGQLFDHAERYRRLHVGHGPTPWATAGHREILDACEAGDRDRSASLLASHLARIGLEVVELLEPDYDPVALRTAVLDVGGELPTRRSGRPRRTSRS